MLRELKRLQKMPFYEKSKLPKFMKKLHLHLQLVNTLSIICPKNIISKQEIKKLYFLVTSTNAFTTRPPEHTINYLS